jgi:molybdopterin-biosynthesis enzyme MoeA-like protein
MLPGPPRFFRHQFEQVAPLLRGPAFRLAMVYLSVGEERFAERLAALALAFPSVEIGSYPRFDEGADHRVRVAVEARDGEAVRAALAALRAALPPEWIVRVDEP